MRSELLIPTPVTLQGGDDAFTAAWARGARPTAVLAVSDIIAMGTLRAARRLGVRVPEDLEVIGFDDIPLAVASQPALVFAKLHIVCPGIVATDVKLAPASVER